jgi:hypothetical protein
MFLPGAQYGLTALQPKEERTYRIGCERVGPVTVSVTTIEGKKHLWSGGRIANFGYKLRVEVNGSGVARFSSVTF